MDEPLFPCVELNGDGSPYRQYLGATLRDHFAAAALQGFAAEGGMPGPTAAKAAYEWADAMLAERNKAKEQANG